MGHSRPTLKTIKMKNTFAVSKTQMQEIARRAKKLLWSHAALITWKQECNLLHYAFYKNTGERPTMDGRQVQFFAYGKSYTIMRDFVADVTFVQLWCGETANVCVDLTGKLVHTRGGAVIK